jgi:glutathione S-transferase
MFDTVVIGFPRSTFVHIGRLILTHKDVPYTFRDLELEMAREWAVSHRPKY